VDRQDYGSLALWAVDCAEHVLPYFEEKYPEDERPRKSIESALTWARGEIRVGAARAALKAGLDPDSGEVSEAMAALVDRGYVKGINIIGQRVYRITASGIEEATRPA
jgi:hypothetical protein